MTAGRLQDNRGKPANRQTGKPANRQTGKPANRQTGKPANRQTGKPAAGKLGCGSHRHGPQPLMTSVARTGIATKMNQRGRHGCAPSGL
jgi:hypothetical protein